MIDLIEELDAIRLRAKETRERLVTGGAKNGIAGLVAIEHRAADAIRHATEDLQDEAAPLTGQSRQLTSKRRDDRTTRP